MADERLRTIGRAFLAKVAQRLATLDPAELDAADVARWTDVALKLEQAGSQRGSYDRQASLAQMSVGEPPTGEPQEGDEDETHHP